MVDLRNGGGIENSSDIENRNPVNGVDDDARDDGDSDDLFVDANQFFVHPVHPLQQQIPRKQSQRLTDEVENRDLNDQAYERKTRNRKRKVISGYKIVHCEGCNCRKRPKNNSPSKRFDEHQTDDVSRSAGNILNLS
ncbi:unnamed protein product [Anisakis simplex]|uniref:Uncharacterized protein n=1 Tax=Anisakis simplex TaxID=6269 RepID=A0A0M3KJB1_ANISI|nr:unnamed protein product [Anisakis simplex]VDK77066.1 unnamed protein product [Anisakis simplex]